jgi:hypothetical protein
MTKKRIFGLRVHETFAARKRLSFFGKPGNAEPWTIGRAPARPRGCPQGRKGGCGQARQAMFVRRTKCGK